MRLNEISEYGVKNNFGDRKKYYFKVDYTYNMYDPNIYVCSCLNQTILYAILNYVEHVLIENDIIDLEELPCDNFDEISFSEFLINNFPVFEAERPAKFTMIDMYIGYEREHNSDIAIRALKEFNVTDADILRHFIIKRVDYDMNDIKQINSKPLSLLPENIPAMDIQHDTGGESRIEIFIADTISDKDWWFSHYRGRIAIEVEKRYGSSIVATEFIGRYDSGEVLSAIQKKYSGIKVMFKKFVAKEKSYE